MIASLPMYDTAATQAANDRLWAGIRHRLGFGPETLSRGTDPHEEWLRPDLLLSQTCSLPYRTELAGKVRLIGTPDYGVEGCPSGFYRSVIVVRKNDPRQNLSAFAGARLARNDTRSHSGWAAIDQHIIEHAIPVNFAGCIVETGAHAASASAVAESEADLAALDAVTWALMQRDTDATSNLRVLTHTKPTPGLPLITSLAHEPDKLFSVVEDAIAALTSEDKSALMIKGLVRIPKKHYLSGHIPLA